MQTLRAAAALSLTGRFAQFGSQAANGLRLWAEECGAELTIVDDESEPAVLTERLGRLAPDMDVVFGPYSTVLIRAAIPVAKAAGRLLFNHGGSGGNLMHPGRVVNVLTPARRYTAPFIAYLARVGGGPLYVPSARGAFGRDVIGGATDAAIAAGLNVCRLDLKLPPAGTWDLLSAGVYEDDVATVRAARTMANPPRHVCSVAAGIAAFADDVPDPEGVYGVGQWAPDDTQAVDAGMGGSEFLAAWRDRFGGVPDYPAVQAYAAGVIAGVACHNATTDAQDALWRSAAGLDVTTVFGRFRLDPATGKQVGHEAVLTRWRGGRQAVV